MNDKPEIGKGQTDPDETIKFEAKSKLLKLVGKKNEKGEDIDGKEWKR